MNHWLFVSAAYAVVLVGAVGVAWLSDAAMRRAAAAAEAVGRK